LVIESRGKHYLAGEISAAGEGGSSFSASFTVDESGSIDEIEISDHGKEYTGTPVLNILYQGAAYLQASVASCQLICKQDRYCMA